MPYSYSEYLYYRIVPGKWQKLRVGSCTEEVLKWFNYPPARTHPDAKLAARV